MLAPIRIAILCLSWAIVCTSCATSSPPSLSDGSPDVNEKTDLHAANTSSQEPRTALGEELRDLVGYLDGIDSGPLGVTVRENQLVILIPCQDARIKQMRVAGRGPYRLIWGVDFPRPWTGDEIVVGEVPRDGLEAMPFSGDLPETISVTALADDRLGYAVVFDFAEMEEGKILIAGDSLDPITYEQVAEGDYCS